jgi:hypothetical protein
MEGNEFPDVKPIKDYTAALDLPAKVNSCHGCSSFDTIIELGSRQPEHLPKRNKERKRVLNSYEIDGGKKQSGGSIWKPVFLM